MADERVGSANRPGSASRAPATAAATATGVPGGRVGSSIGIALGILAVLLAAAGIIAWARTGFGPLPHRFITPISMLVLAGNVVTSALAAAILVTRRPEHPIGYLTALFSVIATGPVVANGIPALAATGQPVAIDPTLATMFAEVALPISAAIQMVTILLFPTGRLLGPRWRLAVVGAIVGGLSMAIGVAFTPGRLLLATDIQNPLGVANPPLWLPLLRNVVGPGLLVAAGVACAVSTVRRYRPADVETRLQLRWYVAAVIAIVIGFAANMYAIVFLPPDAGLGRLIVLGFSLTVILPPVAVVIAIMRYRLYGIDTIISRTFVYGALTAILAGMYAASVRLFNTVLADVTGDSSEVALVITTLILATTFTPIKKRLEEAVDRRLKGPAPSLESSPPAIAIPFEDAGFRAAVRDEVRKALREARADAGRTSKASARRSGPHR